MNKLFSSRCLISLLFIVTFILNTNNIFAKEAPQVTRWIHPEGTLIANAQKNSAVLMRTPPDVDIHTEIYLTGRK